MDQKDTENKAESAIRNSKYAVVAIHAGGIESFTGEIAKAIAGGEHSVFVFHGQGQHDHVTSTQFDHPGLTDILSKAETVISIHGEHEKDHEFIMVGGLNKELGSTVTKRLNDAGFSIKTAADGLRGQSPDNVVNRGKSRKGVQLEISRALRNDMKHNRQLFKSFTDSIRSALKTDTIKA